MDAAQTWNYIISSVTGTFGMLIGIILFAVNKEKSLSVKLLSGVLFSTSIFAVNFGLVGTSFFLHYPHLWRSSALFAGLLPAFSFLYVQSVLNQQLRLRTRDFLFFIPGVINSLNFLPFYMLSAEEKRVILSKILSNRQLVSHQRELDGIFPNGWGMAIRLGIGILLMTSALFSIRESKRKSALGGGQMVWLNKGMYHWLYFLSFSGFFSFLFVIIWARIGNHDLLSLNAMISVTTTCYTLMICIYLFSKPSILYGMRGFVGGPSVVAAPSPVDLLPPEVLSEEQKKPFLTNEIRLDLALRLESHFKTNKPFLKAGYKIKDLSLELDTPIYIVSSFINQEYGMNFNEMVNDFRVDHVAEVLRASADSQRFTLEAIAKSAGFNSRTTFIDAVKKKSGMTPSSYFSKQIS